MPHECPFCQAQTEGNRDPNHVAHSYGGDVEFYCRSLEVSVWLSDLEREEEADD